MEPILDDIGLAQLLKAPDKVLTRLLERTDLPRFTLGGERRYLASAVLAWVARHDGQELLPADAAPPAAPPEPPPQPPPAAPREPVHAMFAAAAEGESPWYTDDAIDSLERGAGEPGMNLDRLKLRDALLELNDALLPMLSRLSGERLHPHHDEKQRTSPWRLELDSKDRIESISIAWGAGEHAPPDFTDRPHVKVELRRHTLVVRLDTHRKTFSPPLSDGERESLGRAGFEVGDHVAKVYRLPETPPTLDTVAHLIERDLGLLVPLWIRLA